MAHVCSDDETHSPSLHQLLSGRDGEVLSIGHIFFLS